MKKSFFIFFILIFFFTVFVHADDEEEHARARLDLIQKGISYLIGRQKGDGSWPLVKNRAAISSLAGLALLGAGHLPKRGPYGDNVENLKREFISSQREDGLIAMDGYESMYGHGFATLFLSQLYGMTGYHREIKAALQKAVRFIENHQSLTGGWYYFPFSSNDEGSVTIVQVQALRAAKDVGIEVRYETVEKAVDYVKRSQCADGGIAYWAGPKGNQTTSLTSAGMAVLFNAGEYQIGNVQKKGFRYLDERFDQMMSPRTQGEFFYTHFYAAQVYRQRGEIEFKKYFNEIEYQLKKIAIRTKGGDVYWGMDESGHHYNYFIYSTSMALLILEIPLGYLPIFTH